MPEFKILDLVSHFPEIVGHSFKIDRMETFDGREDIVLVFLHVIDKDGVAINGIAPIWVEVTWTAQERLLRVTANFDLDYIGNAEKDQLALFGTINALNATSKDRIGMISTGIAGPRSPRPGMLVGLLSHTTEIPQGFLESSTGQQAFRQLAEHTIARIALEMDVVASELRARLQDATEAQVPPATLQ